MRPLREHERQTILPALIDVGVADEPVCRRAIEQCRLICQLPSVFDIERPKAGVAYLALRTRASGITLGNEVFVRSEYFDGDRNLPMQLLAHEVAHVAQFERDGRLPFLCRYVWDYGVGLAAGRGDRQAYRDIGYEREARRVADYVSPVRN
jgi:hypothetical protein